MNEIILIIKCTLDVQKCDNDNHHKKYCIIISLSSLFISVLQLIVLDTTSGRMTNIPKLKSSEESIPAKCPCGIHSIAINPSNTLLATGANHTNDIAVYKLPTFDPVCVGEVRGWSMFSKASFKETVPIFSQLL